MRVYKCESSIFPNADVLSSYRHCIVVLMSTPEIDKVR